MKGRAAHQAVVQKSRLALSSSDGDVEEELLTSTSEGLGASPQSMARSSTSSRPANPRGSAAGSLLGSTGSSGLSKSRRRWGCYGNKGRCVNLFLVLSLLLSVASLLISSLSFASMFPVAGQTTLSDRVVYSPCRFLIAGMWSAASSGWTSRCSNFLLGLSSQSKSSASLANSVEHGHFYLKPPAARSSNRDLVSKSYVTTSNNRGLAHEGEAQPLSAKPVLPSQVVQHEGPKLPSRYSPLQDGNVFVLKQPAGTVGSMNASLASNVSSTMSGDLAVSDYESNSPSVPVPLLTKKKKHRGNVQKVNATRIRPEGRILSDHTITSLYSVRNDFGFRVNYYVFHTLCFNSTHVLLVGPETCLQGWDAASDSDLTAVACDDSTYVPRRKMLRETHLAEASATREWLQQRNVTWWNGTSALVHLDRSSANVAHFIGK